MVMLKANNFDLIRLIAALRVVRHQQPAHWLQRSGVSGFRQIFSGALYHLECDCAAGVCVGPFVEKPSLDFKRYPAYQYHAPVVYRIRGFSSSTDKGLRG